MKLKLPVYFSFPTVLLLVCVPFAIASGFASAAVYTWDGGGGDNNWSTADNWNTALIPATDSDLIFSGSSRLSPANNLTALGNFGSLSFSSGASAFTLGGNSITLNGNITNSSSSTQTIGLALTLTTGPHTVTTNATGAVILNGVMSGDGSLIKAGAGTLTLSAASSFTGSTTINSGTLALSSVGGKLADSAVTVNSTGIFTLSNNSATGSAPISRSNGLTLNGGKLAVTGSSLQNTTDVFGVLTLGQGAGYKETSGTGSPGALSGGNNVIMVTPNSAKNSRLNFAGVDLTEGGSVVFVSSGPNLGASTLASSAAGGINIAFATAPTLIGAAVSGGVMSTTSGIIPWASTNGTAGNFPSDFVIYDSDYGVRTLTAYASNFALSSGVAQNVKLTTAIAMGIPNATVNSLIFNGDINQTINGTLTVNSGALLFSGSSSNSTISGGTLQLGTGGDSFIETAQNRVNTISSVISGPDSDHFLTINFGNANAASGTFVLSGNNSYDGGTIVNSTNSSSALVIGGTSTSGQALTAGTSGSFGSGDVTLNSIKILLNRSNAFTLANNFGGTGVSVIQQSATGMATLSGNISGTVGVTQSTASSSLVLSGTNTYNGATTLSAGTLQLNGPASLSTGSALTLTNGTTLNLRNDTTTSFTPASITTSGNGTFNFDVNTLTSTTGQTLTLAGGIAFGSANQQINATSGGTGYVLGLGAISHNTTANDFSFTVNATTAAVDISSFTFGSWGSNLTLQGGNNISVGGLLFSSNSTETITIAGANATFTGGNTAINGRSTGGYSVILNSGKLNMNNAGFMTNPNGSAPTLTIAGGTLDNTTGGSITQSTNATVMLNGDFTFGGTNALNLGTGPVTLSASRQITTNGTGALTLGGSISGSGHTITKAGSGNLTLGGAINTGSGGVTVNGGTLTLSATNTYSGATNVSAGKLVVNGSIANSAVTVSNAGTILASDAAATIGSSLVIHNGAILAPGDAGSAGVATVVGDTSLNNGSIFSWDINSTGTSFDKLVSATLTDGDAAGGSIFRIVAADQTFADTFWNATRTWSNIFTTDGSSPIANWASIFSTVSVVNSNFDAITPANGSFSLSGSILTWTAVPEPTGAFAGLLVAAGLMRRRRN